MSWYFGFDVAKYSLYRKAILIAVVGGLVFFVSLLLANYSAKYYFTQIFEQARSNNARQLVELREQVSSVLERLNALGLHHQGQGSACNSVLFEELAGLVDVNRFIQETAVELEAGIFCTSYGSVYGAQKGFAYEQSHPGYQFKIGDAIRTYWFNAGSNTTLNSGEILIREGNAHLRINKGILLGALDLDKTVSFSLFERQHPRAVLAIDELVYSPDTITSPEEVVISDEAVFYAYPVKWNELIALLAVPKSYYQAVWGRLLLLYIGGVIALIILILSIASRVYLFKYSLQAKLKNALRDGQLQALYQPIVDMCTGQVVGAEALMRWPLNGRLVSPSQFIPLAESTGLITDLTLRCCEQVAKELSMLLAHSRKYYVSINLSTIALASPGIAKKLHTILSRYAVRPDQVVFEVTESFAVAGVIAESQLFYLREMGYRIALDDFGTGASNLIYLEKLPTDIIKIDKTFVTLDKIHSPDSVWRHMASIAQSLDVTIIVEGVEEVEQIEPLLSEGVRYAQGYYYYKPLAFKELFNVMVENKGTQPEQDFVSEPACLL